MITPHLVQIVLLLIRSRIFPIFLCQFKRLVQIKFRIINHRKHLSVFRIHHKNTDGIRVLLQIRFFRCLRGKKLNVCIQRKPQIVSRNRLDALLTDIVNLHASGIRRGQNRSILSLQIVIVHRLQTDDSLIVAAGKAQHLRCQIVIRILSLVVLIHFDARIPIGKNTVARLFINITFDFLNRRVFFHAFTHALLRQIQLLYKHCDHALRILDLIMDHRDRAHRLITCEHNSACIKNLAARRLDLPLSLLQIGCKPGVIISAKDHKIY